MQPESETQEVAQAVPEAHWYGEQVNELLVQLPPAWHSGPVRIPLAQLLAPHEVLTGALQVPEPSQLSTLQVATLAVHSDFGSVPEVAKTHEVPAALITWHGGHEATTAQREPACAWTQLLDRHWVPVLHTEPFASLPVHVGGVQVKLARH